MLLKCFFKLIFLILSVLFVENAHSYKYKMCVLDGKGGFQKSDNYCPKLESPESLIECVKGLDRFDCLRKIRRGLADFSIFTSEDLIAALNTDNDILITNELRFSDVDKHEEEVVAIVRTDSGIKTTYDLTEKTLCHPGYGSSGFVSEVLANFLESTVVRPQSCQPRLTVPENRIASSSSYFKSACKPGPWVNDAEVDRELKRKYPNLCKACYSQYSCSGDDKYYGSSGSLYCLTDGAGDIAWTTYKQLQLQFKLNEGNITEEASQYRFLCKDDSLRPLNDTEPCIWAAKPWTVVAASSQTASAIQKIVQQLTHSSDWRGSVLNLLEVIGYHVTIHTLDNVEDVDSYLRRVPGYLNANSFTGCHPPRTVKVCTTSIPAQYKCGWMREAAAVMGIEPDIDCLKADNETHCMEAIQRNVADVVIVHPDYMNIAKREYDLKSIFYETVQDDHKYLTVAVVRRESNIKTIEELRGKRACFPMHDGVAWNTMVYELSRKNLLVGCPFEEGVLNFFGESCVPDIATKFGHKMGKLCTNEYRRDVGALKCLKDKVGDVAFVSQNALREFLMEREQLNWNIRVINEETPNYFSWAPVGQAMVSKNISSWRSKDILDVFLELDNLFGKNSVEQTKMFTMYGEFDAKRDILFDDNTVQLRKSPKLKDYDQMPKLYEDILQKPIACIPSNSSRIVPSILIIFIIAILNFRLC